MRNFQGLSCMNAIILWNFQIWIRVPITLSWRRLLSNRNQSTNFLCKLMGRFLCDRDLCHEKVKMSFRKHVEEILSNLNACPISSIPIILFSYITTSVSYVLIKTLIETVFKTICLSILLEQQGYKDASYITYKILDVIIFTVIAINMQLAFLKVHRVAIIPALDKPSYLQT